LSLYLVNPYNSPATCTTGIIYNNLSNQNGDGVIATGYQIRYGQEISADNAKIGDSVDKMTIKAKGFGSPDGVLQCRIYSGSVGSSSKTLVATSTTTLDCSAVSTSAQTEYSFVFATFHTVSAGDCYVIELTTNTSTSFSNRIGVGYYNSTLANTTIVTSTVSSPSTFTFNSPSGYSMSHKVEATCP